MRCGSDARAVAAGDRLGGADEQQRGDDGQHEAEDVELPDAAGAEQPGDRAADQRADHAEAEGREQAEVLLAGLEQPRQRSDDQAGDEETDHVSTVARAWLPAGVCSPASTAKGSVLSGGGTGQVAKSV